MDFIDKVGALIHDDAGRVLLVRAVDSAVFLAPGGQREKGEDDEACLAREIREELGVGVAYTDYFGTWEADAEGRPGKRVRMTVLRAWLDGEPEPNGEITEIVWYDGTQDVRVGSIMRDYVIPWAWGVIPHGTECG